MYIKGREQRTKEASHPPRNSDDKNNLHWRVAQLPLANKGVIFLIAPEENAWLRCPPAKLGMRCETETGMARARGSVAFKLLTPVDTFHAMTTIGGDQRNQLPNDELETLA